MNIRRWLIAAATVVIAIALVAGAAGYRLWYRPRVEDARALAAVQFIQLPVATWNVLYRQGASGLPSPYPTKLEDLSEHGLTDETTIAFYRRDAVIGYFPPPEDLAGDALNDWEVVKATTPRGTWVGTFGGDRRWEAKP